MKILPNSDNLLIPLEKFTQYALNPTKESNKSKAFERALGYDLNNVEELIDNIRKNANKFNAIEKSDMGYGKRYEVLITLIGANGKKANVKTAWVVDIVSTKTRLISAYVTRKRFS